MSDDIKGVSRWLEQLKHGSDAIERAGVVAGANEAAKNGLRAYTGADRLSVPLPGAIRNAPKIKAAIQAGMDAEFERQST